MACFWEGIISSLSQDDKDKLEVGLDEAGRGCLFGPVCVASVIWLDEDPDPTMEIKDSKKVSEKKRNILRDYIIDNALFRIKKVTSDSGKYFLHPRINGFSGTLFSNGK